jgi:hypothetical protein
LLKTLISSSILAPLKSQKEKKKRNKKRQPLPLRRLQFSELETVKGAKPPGGKASKLFSLKGACNQAGRQAELPR